MKIMLATGLACLISCSIVVGAEAQAAQGQAYEPVSAQSDIAQLLYQARALIQTNRASEAYELLKPQESAQTGNVEFDYLLGVCAMNAGKYDRSVIILERALAENPNYLDTRLRLAIAYFMSNDMERAKVEFNKVLAQGQTSFEKFYASQYLAAIRQQEYAKELAARNALKPYMLGSVETGLGRDSNLASSATDYLRGFQSAYAPLLTLYNIPNYVPAIIPNPIADNFYFLNGSMEGRYPLGLGGTYAFVSADSNLRRYGVEGRYGIETRAAKVGVNFAGGANTYKFNWVQREYRQAGANEDGVNNSVTTGWEGDIHLVLAPANILGLTAGYSRLRYAASSMAAQETNQFSLGANFVHRFSAKGNPILYAGFTRAKDSAVRPLSAVDATGARINTVAGKLVTNFVSYAQWSFFENADVFTMLSASFSGDNGAYATAPAIAFSKIITRTASLGVNWRPWPGWTVKASMAKTNTDSIDSLLTNSKTERALSLKREFQ